MASEYFLNDARIHCKDTNEECIGYKEYLKSNHWKKLRRRYVKKTSICEMCNKNKSNLQLHHKTYVNLGNEDREDLMIPCPKCHAEVHAKNKPKNNNTCDISYVENLISGNDSAGYIVIPLALIRNFDIRAATVYAEIFRKYKYYLQKNKLTKDGYFYCTVNLLEERFSISQSTQNRILKELEEQGLLKRSFRGIPKKRYIKLLFDKSAIDKAFSLQKYQDSNKSNPLE